MLDDEILNEIRYQMQRSSYFHNQLHAAAKAKNGVWAERLIRGVIGSGKFIGQALIQAAIGVIFGVWIPVWWS